MRTLKRKLLVVAFMLLSTAALIASDTQPVCAFEYCGNCVEKCRNDSFSIYLQCRNPTNGMPGGSVDECEEQQNQYYRACASMFCYGCRIPPMM